MIANNSVRTYMTVKEFKRALALIPVLFGPEWLVMRLCKNKIYVQWLDPKGWFGI